MLAFSNPMQLPQISIIIPLYNHQNYIKESIESVLEQTYSDFELIVINDGSTDGSESVVRLIRDPRIRYFHQENQGAHATINRGLELAHGKYVSILNSDDVYEESRFEHCIETFENDSSLDAVFSYVDVIDEQGGKLEFVDQNYFWENKGAHLSFKNDPNMLLNLLAGNFLMTTSNLFCKKSVIAKIGYFRNFRYVHDYDFFLRLCFHCHVHLIKKPLLRYRRHHQNTINENQAATDYERGLMLADFFYNCDLAQRLPDEHRNILMTKFYNSLSAWDSEKVILTFLIFAMRHPNWGKSFIYQGKHLENPFKANCIRHLTAVKQKENAFWDNYHASVEARKELDRVYQSKAYQLGKLFREARYSIKDLFRLPLRLVRLLLPYR